MFAQPPRALPRILVLAGVLAWAAPPGVAGEIEGTVQITKPPPRKTAKRYPGRQGSSRAKTEPLPAVAYIVGPVAGAPATPPAEPPRMVQSGTRFFLKRDGALLPPVLAVTVGTTVAFPNEDDTFHNVFSYSKAKRFDLGRYSKGETKSVQFDEPGLVKVFCEIHKVMRAAILVLENPFHTMVEKDGTFRIPDLPAGQYQLAVWQADVGEQRVAVDVPAQGTARVAITLSK